MGGPTKSYTHTIPGGLGDGSPPVGSRGEAPVGGLGDEVPQKLKHFDNYELAFLLSDNSKRQ